MVKRRFSILLAAFCFIMALGWESCRKDSPDPGPAVESLKFAENKIELMAGDFKSIGLTVNPLAAKDSIKVEYTVSGRDIIVIDAKHSGNDGVVFEAVGPGNVVIMAKASGIVDYCDVTVLGGNEASIPYIALTDSVLEIPLGRKKHAVASLQGGVMADYSNFMFSNENDRIVALDYANNTAVLEGIAPGSSRITVSHPKAQYAVDIIAFVVTEGQTARYITGENVVFMTLGGSSREYDIRMIGFDESELNYCSYKVVQGSDIVSVTGSGGSCTIEAKREGAAKVQVSHQSAEYPFEFQVVVNKNNETRYITADKNFFLLSGGTVVTVNLSVNTDNFDADSNYLWTVDTENVIEINNVNNTLIVKALNNGTAKVTVTNKYADYPCEILFVVHQGTVIEGEEKFIRTSQQVIQMEKGGPDARLLIELVGGTQADHNSFEWVVEDSSIITAQAPGRVEHRAMAAVSSTVEALITAHKTGTTRIIVSNPAAGVQNEVSVLVKVYPYGTFYGKAVSLSGPGIIKVQTGDEKEIYTPVVGGNANLMGGTAWSSGDAEVAQVNGSGLHGVVKGIKQGITQIRVDGDGVVNPYEGVIMVYSPGQEEYMPYIYADHLRYDVPLGAMQRIAIYHPNTPNENFILDVQKSPVNDNSVFLVKQNNIILVNGAAAGRCVLTVSDKANPGCNTLTIAINVVDNEVDVDHPYSLSGDGFFGIGLDETDKTYAVMMAGADRSELAKLFYTIDDPGVAAIVRSNENQVVLKGVKAGQTTLRINHGRSVNEKAVVVFVTAKAADVKDTIVIGIEKPNYVMYPTQSIFLRLITNATEAQKKTFIWKRDGDTVVGYDTNYDTAMITALRAGSAKITVSTAENIHLIDLDIFITVTEYSNLQPELGYPDSVVVVKNQSKVIKGNAVNASPGQIGSIQYSLEDSSIARITPNGLDVTVQGDTKGQTYLNVSCANLGFFKKILVICVNTEAELENLYYFTAEKPLYRIKKGEQVDIGLKFGETLFEQYNRQIKWENTVSGGAVEIVPKGPGATVLGRNVGVAVIKASHDQALLPVFITVEVTETVTGSDYYWFMYDPIHQMSQHTAGFVNVSVYYGNTYYQDEAGSVTHGQPLTGLYEFTVTSDNPVVATAGYSGGQVRVLAGYPGSAVITLSHPLIREDARILVVVYDGDVPEAPGFILFAPKTHYLLDQGITEKITLNANQPQAPVGLYWHNHNPDIVTFEPEADNYKRAVTAVQAGSAVITIELPMGHVLETVYVGVSSEGDSAEVQAATESIVVLSLNDTNYTTRVIVSGAGTGNIYWRVKNEFVVEVVGSGTSAYLNPRNAGMTELTVEGPGFRRVIVVKVVPPGENVLSAKLINIDQRSYKLKKGQKITVQPYFKIAQPVSVTQAIPSFDNAVIQTRINDKSIEVTAKNIGIERLKVRNDDCDNKEIELEFEVSDSVEGIVSESRKLVYMMTQTPFIRLEPGFTDCYVRLSVIGEYQGAQGDFIWSSDNSNVTINAFGDSALISAGKNHTTSVITVTNAKYCAEPLYITVAVGPQTVYESMTEPYIQADKTVYTAPIGGPALSIPLDIHNVGAVNWMALQYYGEKQFVHITQAAGSLKVEPLAIGTDIIHVNYPGVKRELLIYVAVTRSGENSAVYLTTAQNYIIINQNNAQAVEIGMVGFMEPDASKIQWNSSDPSVCYVVGNGRTVQVVGLKPGVTKITAEHVGSPKAYNALDIVVKVIPPGSDEQVCYLTTGDNVIETYIGAQNGQITINKVGGKVSAVDATWTVDDPTVVGVVGVNNIGYYTPKKAGVAKVTVADREAGALSLVIIVRASRPGSQYLYTAEPVVLIRPGTSNQTLSVTLDGGEESDEKDFHWQIYGQLPSNPEIAKQGGSVVVLYGQGPRASVSGVYAGTARIKVTHPKAAEALFIVVQVSSESSLRFGQSSIDIVVGELSCVTLRVPEWENFTDKIKYSTRNPSVCTVLGTHRAAVLTGVNTGTTEVTAQVEGTDMTAVINVNIIPRQTYKEPQIAVSRTMYVFSPREAPVMLSAQLVGVGIVETDNDLLEWNVINNENMIKIFPETNNANHSKGREIQLEVINRSYPVSAICTIEITCQSLKLSESAKRTIVITIQEDTNALRLSKTNINMESGDMAELSCTIMGGTTKDYDEVIWEAERDSFDKTKDIVKIMGKGKTIQLLGVADGVIKVTCVFRALTRDCRVEVKSSQYFNIMYQTFGCYPGQKVEEPGYVGAPYIKYEVRPVTAPISWIDTDTDYDHKLAVYGIEPAKDVNGTGVGKIVIDPLREGSFTLMGMSGQRSSKVVIYIKNEYLFRVESSQVHTSPLDFPKDFNGEPYAGLEDKEKKNTVEYIISPGSTAKIRLEPKNGLQASDMENYYYTQKGLEVKIEEAKSTPDSGMRGNGKIKFRALKEFDSYGVEVTFRLLMANGQPMAGDEYKKTITVHSRYPVSEGRLVPVLENIDAPRGYDEYGKYLPDYNLSDKGNNEANRIAASDRSKQYNRPTGALYHAGKYLTFGNLSGQNNDGIVNQNGIDDTYYATISDGEQYYILLDKVNPDVTIQNITITATGNDGTFNNGDKVIDNAPFGSNKQKGRGLTVEKVTLQDNNIALRVSGGKDLITYPYFGSEYRMEVPLSSNIPNNVEKHDPYYKRVHIGHPANEASDTFYVDFYSDDGKNYFNTIVYDVTEAERVTGYANSNTNSRYEYKKLTGKVDFFNKVNGLPVKETLTLIKYEHVSGTFNSAYRNYWALLHNEEGKDNMIVLAKQHPEGKEQFIFFNADVTNGNSITVDGVKIPHETVPSISIGTKGMFWNNISFNFHSVHPGNSDNEGVYIFVKPETDKGKAAPTRWKLTGVNDPSDPSNFYKSNGDSIDGDKPKIYIERTHTGALNNDQPYMVFNPRDNNGSGQKWHPLGITENNIFQGYEENGYNCIIYLTKNNESYLYNFITGYVYKLENDGKSLKKNNNEYDITLLNTSIYDIIPSNFYYSSNYNTDNTKKSPNGWGVHAGINIGKGFYIPNQEWQKHINKLRDFPYVITKSGGTATVPDDVLFTLIDVTQERRNVNAPVDRYASPGTGDLVYYPLSSYNQYNSVLDDPYKDYTITINYKTPRDIGDNVNRTLTIKLTYTVFTDHYKNNTSRIKGSWTDGDNDINPTVTVKNDVFGSVSPKYFKDSIEIAEDANGKVRIAKSSAANQ